MAKKVLYSFTDKKHTRNGILSSILAGVSLLIFLILAVISFLMRGAAGTYVGALGLSAMVLSFTGLVIGLKSFAEKDKLYFYSKLGSVSCGVITIGWLALVLIGL